MKSHNDQSMTKTAPGPGVQETVPGVAASAQLDRAAIWVLVSLSLAALLSSLGTSIANVGLPTLAQTFGASFSQVQWVVLAYLLAITTLIVSAGRLGDLFGRRRMLLTGIALFSAASVLCALALSLGLLIAARVIQGLGAALMMSLAMALVGESIRKEKTGSAMGIIGTVSAIGTALGPSLGGALIELGGWPLIFLVNAPVGILAWLLAFRFLPVDRQSTTGIKPRFDTRGTLLLTLTLTAYALAMTLRPGQFAAFHVVLLLVAGLGLLFFIRSQAHAAAPLMRLSMFRDPVLTTGFAMSTLVSSVVMATLVVGPFYLTGALALDVTLVGLAMASGPLVAALIGAPAGYLVDRLGAYRMTRVGLSAMAAGSGLLSLLPSALGVAGYILPLMILTAGYALFQAANNTTVITQLSSQQRGVGSGLLGLSRNLGLITGASVMGLVFALGAGVSDISSARPEDVETGMRITFGVATGLILCALSLAAAAQIWSRADSNPCR